MGNPKLWYTPVSGGTVEELDFSTGAWVSQWQDVMTRDAGDAEAISGLSAHTARGSVLEVGLQCDRFGDSDIAHALMGFQHHAETGGLFGFANDADKAWAAWTTSTPARGDTNVYCGSVGYWNTSATLAAGDWICIESALPNGAREWVKVVSVLTGPGSNQITVSPGLIYDHTGPVLVRHQHYHPALRWPVARRRSMVTSDRQLVWSFSGTFREDRGTLWEDQAEGQGINGGDQPAPRRLDDVNTLNAPQTRGF